MHDGWREKPRRPGTCCSRWRMRLSARLVEGPKTDDGGRARERDADRPRGPASALRELSLSEIRFPSALASFVPQKEFLEKPVFRTLMGLEPVERSAEEQTQLRILPHRSGAVPQCVDRFPELHVLGVEV